jgi:predicted RNA binding protein YcfA (HicA-like mRNA interferase family)
MESYGFEEKRRKGSHIIMQKVQADGTCTVPVPAHKELKAGTLTSIIRQSSIPRSEFE